MLQCPEAGAAAPGTEGGVSATTGGAPGNGDLGAALGGLLGDLLDVPWPGGWRLASAARTRDGFCGLVLEREGRALNLWIAPATADTGCFCATPRFKIGYSDPPPGVADFALLRCLEARVRANEDAAHGALESALAPPDATPPDAPPRDDGPVSGPRDAVLLVTPRCSETCPFCAVDESSPNRCFTEESAVAALRVLAGRGVRDVTLGGGEPTLVGYLPRLVATGRGLGMKVQVDTNGVVGDDGAFWDAFRDDGGRPALPDVLLVSFHTQRPERVGEITGVPGTFDRKVAAVREALRRGVTVAVNFVVTTVNLDELAAFPSFVAATFGTRLSIVFSIVAPSGRARGRPWLWPRLADLAPALDGALASAEGLGITAMVPDVCGVPPCVAPRHLRAFDAVRTPVAVTGAMMRDHAKPESCRACRFDATCVGVWKAVAARDGFGGLAPL
jgi:pyruvate-formate lyase-activating enzyme